MYYVVEFVALLTKILSKNGFLPLQLAKCWRRQTTDFECTPPPTPTPRNKAF